MKLQSLQALVKNFIPAPFENHVRVASFEKGVLTLIAEDANYASQLRFCLSDLREQLRKEGKLFQLISVKIQVDTVV